MEKSRLSHARYFSERAFDVIQFRLVFELAGSFWIMGLYFLILVFGFVVFLFLINGYYLKKDVSDEIDRSKNKKNKNPAKGQKRGKE